MTPLNEKEPALIEHTCVEKFLWQWRMLLFTSLSTFHVPWCLCLSNEVKKQQKKLQLFYKQLQKYLGNPSQLLCSLKKLLNGLKCVLLLPLEFRQKGRMNNEVKAIERRNFQNIWNLQQYSFYLDILGQRFQFFPHLHQGKEKNNLAHGCPGEIGIMWKSQSPPFRCSDTMVMNSLERRQIDSY